MPSSTHVLLMSIRGASGTWCLVSMSRDSGACRFDFYDEDSSGTLDKTEVFRGIVQAQSHPLAYRG
jgi:hypothetical protein